MSQLKIHENDALDGQASTDSVQSGLGFDFQHYEVLKHNIMFSANGTRHKLKKLAVISRYNGEGVTTVASNLALAYAKLTHEPVLYMEMNYRNPNAASVFNVEPTPGLGTILRTHEVSQNCIKSTCIKNLSVIPCGDLDSDPCEFLTLPQLFDKLQQRFKYLVFDLPSLERSQKSALKISGIMDGVILVIEAERVRWEVAERAKRQLLNAEAKILGVVLNKRKYYIPKFLYKSL